MAFLSCAKCVPSLSFSILVAAVHLSLSIRNTQGIAYFRSPGRSTELRPSSEKKSAVDEIETPRVIARSEQPESMQVRRFMWKEVDETMDDIMQGVANGAVIMKGMINNAFSDSNKVTRFQRNAEYRPVTTSNLKYIIKNPPPKVTRMILPNVAPILPKKIVKIVSANPPVHFEPTVKYTGTQTAFIENSYSQPVEDEFKIDTKVLRELEKKEEEKVEATISSILPNALHEEIIIGKYKDDWQPVILDTESTLSFTTQKPHVVSHLNTNVFDVPYNMTGIKQEISYEVTENTAEETIQRPHTSRPNGNKVTRRKGYLAEENKNDPKLYKNHNVGDYSTTESDFSLSKPNALYERSIRINKTTTLSPNSHTSTKSKVPASLKRDITTKLGTTRKPFHLNDKVDIEKLDNLPKQSEIKKTSKGSNSRGSVKFGSNR